MDDIKVIRLQSGEDIVAKYTTNDEGLVFISDPMIFIVKRNEDFRTSIYLTPWLPIDIIKDNVAQITKDDILTVMNPTEEFKDYYVKMVFEEASGVGSYESTNDIFNIGSDNDLLHEDYLDKDIFDDEIESIEAEGTKTIH